MVVVRSVGCGRSELLLKIGFQSSIKNTSTTWTKHENWTVKLAKIFHLQGNLARTEIEIDNYQLTFLYFKMNQDIFNHVRLKYRYSKRAK